MTYEHGQKLIFRGDISDACDEMFVPGETYTVEDYDDENESYSFQEFDEYDDLKAGWAGYFIEDLKKFQPFIDEIKNWKARII